MNANTSELARLAIDATLTVSRGHGEQVGRTSEVPKMVTQRLGWPGMSYRYTTVYLAVVSAVIGLLAALGR